MARENIVFRGTFEACFAHWKHQFESRHPKASRGADEAKQPLADFCGIGTNTVRIWFTNGTYPVGEVYLKLLCFLQVQGYIVNELRGMSATELGLMELVGYGVLTVEHIREHLEFTQAGQLFRVLRGESKLFAERINKGWELLKKHRQALNQKKEACAAHPPYKFGAAIGVPLQHRALLGAMEALMLLLTQEVPKHEIANLSTRLGDAPTDLRDQLDAFMARLKLQQEVPDAVRSPERPPASSPKGRSN